jgi:hypothetical protein
MLVICDHAGTKYCEKVKKIIDIEICDHEIVHKKIKSCKNYYCIAEINVKVKCIPYKEKANEIL